MMRLFKKTKKEDSCCCGNVDSLIVKEGEKVEDKACSCGCEGVCPQAEENDLMKNELSGNKLIIKILGSGCKNCITLAENVHKALDEVNLAAEIIKVTDFADITGYGVMSTPALVINEKVVSYGKVLKPEEVKKLLDKYVPAQY